MALGDLNGDGYLDLVVGNYFNQMDRVYLNDGVGDPWDTASGSDLLDARSTVRILLGDVDRDGNLDVVSIIMNTSQTNRLYRNDGTGTGWTGTSHRLIS